MFKLMIADDNPHTLSGLSEDTDWEDFDFTLTGAFRNGKDLLNAAILDMPDLVITDISMPQMDGITLTGELYRLKPDLKIVFISSYSEFDYAKSALKLHIFDYILKPIQFDQLQDVMGRVLDALHKEQWKLLEQQAAVSRQDYFRKAALSHYASRLLFHVKEEQHMREELNRLGLTLDQDTSIYVVSFSLSNAVLSDHQEQSYDYLRSILECSLDGHIIPAMLEDCQGVFIMCVPNDESSMFDLLSRLCIDIETRMNAHITMGYSNPTNLLTDLPALFTQSQTALRSLLESNAVIPLASYTDMHLGSDSGSPLHTDRIISKNVSAMRDYIEQYYMEPITTNDVAGSVYLSPNYANRCFTAECGITIFGYIVQYRLEKAKELLRDTDEHITRIAELVGYSAKTSFYLAFKRHTGISPTEYRQKNLR